MFLDNLACRIFPHISLSSLLDREPRFHPPRLSLDHQVGWRVTTVTLFLPTMKLCGGTMRENVLGGFRWDTEYIGWLYIDGRSGDVAQRF